MKKKKTSSNSKCQGIPLSEHMTQAALEEAERRHMVLRTPSGSYEAEDFAALYMVTGLSPAGSMDMSFGTPPTPRTHGVLEYGSTMKFPSRRRQIVAHLSMRVVKLVQCGKRWEGCRCVVQWKWGSKESNRGESEVFTISNGQALIVFAFEAVSSFAQEMPAKITEPNRMVLTLQLVRPDRVREIITTRSIDMAQFSVDRCEKTKLFALDKATPAMSLQLTVDTTWLRIDGKPVERALFAAPAHVEELPLASPTTFPSMQPRTSVARAAMVSPVVLHNQMKQGQREKVLETAMSPNPTLEKMMESERQLVARKSPASALAGSAAATGAESAAVSSPRRTPGDKGLKKLKKKLLVSPRGSSGADEAGHGSPFFQRRKDKDHHHRNSPVAVAVPLSGKEKDASSTLFGASLNDIMERQKSGPHASLPVPYVVHYLCCKVLELKGNESEGIFRISIASEDIELYAKRFNAGDYSLPPKDPNYPAVLLKQFLRRLPSPMCPAYDQCLAARSDGAVATIFASLPMHNQNLLKYLSNFISLMMNYEADTKMGLEGFCVVFSPACLVNPVFDYASAILNVSKEQDFMKILVQWIRKRYPDEAVAKEPYKPPVRRATLRRPPPPPPEAVVAPPEFKKRGSSADLQNIVSPTKSHKKSEDSSPQSTVALRAMARNVEYKE